MGSCCSFGLPESEVETEKTHLISNTSFTSKSIPSTGGSSFEKEIQHSLPKKSIPLGESYKNRKENELLQNILQQTQK